MKENLDKVLTVEEISFIDDYFHYKIKLNNTLDGGYGEWDFTIKGVIMICLDKLLLDSKFNYPKFKEFLSSCIGLTHKEFKEKILSYDSEK